MNVKPIPEGFHAVTPYLVVRDVAKQIEFLEKAFGAKTLYRMDTPGGTMHAEVKICDSVVMMGQAMGERKPIRKENLSNEEIARRAKEAHAVKA